eukprot:NODE_2986_length_960_cov_2.649460_g2966_i0.p1 GENE.NODE_2986_length_960_cov_2.649460_g2966_i0~~NODE_2986_length_960_cov_2.649460_g2966_i0.p1  ORF type:complete len:310 (-),score=65.29 NODE_2986_length_960_cov_2.649460_g2966_i0:31-888(-)
MVGNALRPLRFLRLISKVKMFQVIATCSSQMLPVVGSLLASVAVLFYAYSMIGMATFGGMLPTAANKPEYQASTFKANGYEVLNFDTLVNSYIVLFCLMVVNNWHVIMDGWMLATNRVAVLFFVSFYMLVVLVAANLVVAQLLDLYDNTTSSREALSLSLCERRVLALLSNQKKFAGREYRILDRKSHDDVLMDLFLGNRTERLQIGDVLDDVEVAQPVSTFDGQMIPLHKAKLTTNGLEQELLDEEHQSVRVRLMRSQHGNMLVHFLPNAGGAAVNMNPLSKGL